MVDVYPLVTHDPNMLKKVTRELSWTIKVSLPEGKYENFRQKQFTLVQEVLQSPKYSTMMCDRLSPFFISKAIFSFLRLEIMALLSRATSLFQSLSVHATTH